MALHLNTDDSIFLFSSIGDGYVEVNQQRYTENLIVQPKKLHPRWTAANFNDLTLADFKFLAGLGPEVLLLGTGPLLRFPPSSLLRPLIEAGIGVEVMDLGAACRTYNILANENRNVTAALLFH